MEMGTRHTQRMTRRLHLTLKGLVRLQRKEADDFDSKNLKGFFGAIVLEKKTLMS